MVFVVLTPALAHYHQLINHKKTVDTVPNHAAHSEQYQKEKTMEEYIVKRPLKRQPIHPGEIFS